MKRSDRVGPPPPSRCLMLSTRSQFPGSSSSVCAHLQRQDLLELIADPSAKLEEFMGGAFNGLDLRDLCLHFIPWIIAPCNYVQVV